MKLIHSLLLLVTLGLLVNNASSSEQPLFTACEMREVDRRLNAIGNL